MKKILEFIKGLLFGIVINVCVGWILKVTVPKPKHPDFIKDEDWDEFMNRSGGNRGAWIGFFERLLIFLFVWLNQPTIIVAWFAFKVAAKWESWKNIAQVPHTLKDVDDITWYRVRHSLGSWILARFLIGTIINILVGTIAGLIVRNYYNLSALLPQIKN